jgi:hypothetical protein
MISYEQFLNNKLVEVDNSSIYATPDKAKAITIMNQAISQLPGIISNLKDLAQKLESASLNSTKLKNSAQSLEKLVEMYKKEITA